MNSEAVPQGINAGKVHLQVDLLKQLEISEYRIQDLQSQLNSLQERFNHILNATQEVAWDWNLANGNAWFSEGLQTLLGHPSSLQTDPTAFWKSTVHPEDRDRVLTGLYSFIAGNERNRSERYRLGKADGTYVWVQDRCYAIRDYQEKAIRLVGAIRDITVETEANDALRESEEMFNGLFDQAVVGISIAGPKGEFLAVNKAYPAIFGFTEEEIKTKTISDLSHPDEIEGDRKIMQHLLSGKTQIAAREKRYIHKSGKVIWGRVFGTIVYNANKIPKYFIGVLEDVTDRHTADAALKEKEERLSLVIDAGRIGTWDFDIPAATLHWDKRCREMSGMNDDDRTDYSVFLDRVHPHDRPMVNEAHMNAIQGLNDGEYALDYRTIGLRDNQLRWVRAKGRAYKNENGIVYRFTGVVIDITEEKEKEQDLRMQEERFRRLVTNIPQIVWTTDRDGVVDYISDTWEAYTGHKPTYIKASFRQLIHPEDLPGVTEELDACIRNGTVYTGDYRLKNLHTGQYRWFSAVIAPVKNNQNQVIKWVGSATEIHDKKEHEIALENKVAERTLELREINARLERSNSELEQYAYVTSHDLKEPLRKIQMYLNLVTSKHPALPNDLTGYLDKAKTAASRMSGLIQDLLDYSRTSDPIQSYTDVDLNETIAGILADMDEMLKEKQVVVNLTELPTVWAVPIQMHQLFLNLISNATKFSKANTTNTITITYTALPNEQLLEYPNLNQQQRYHKIVFKDEGIGFAAEYREKIFAIFQRLDKTISGHGIGLSLCRKIVNNHNGIIEAYGEEGKGATFTLILPASGAN